MHDMLRCRCVHGHGGRCSGKSVRHCAPLFCIAYVCSPVFQRYRAWQECPEGVWWSRVAQPRECIRPCEGTSHLRSPHYTAFVARWGHTHTQRRLASTPCPFCCVLPHLDTPKHVREMAKGRGGEWARKATLQADLHPHLCSAFDTPSSFLPRPPCHFGGGGGHERDPYRKQTQNAPAHVCASDVIRAPSAPPDIYPRPAKCVCVGGGGREEQKDGRPRARITTATNVERLEQHLDNVASDPRRGPAGGG